MSDIVVLSITTCLKNIDHVSMLVLLVAFFFREMYNIS